MNKVVREVSLFSGIGGFERGLQQAGVDYELVNYCEIEPHASQCYAKIHNVSEDLNLIDVCKVDGTKLPPFNLLTHGSPCQSFSATGKQEGGVKGSGTKSSLLWETVRIVTETMPEHIIWENVDNVLRPKHRGVFEEYLQALVDLGYNNYVPKNKKGQYCCLNSKDYGIPQSRERIFVVSIRKDVDDGTFKWPNPIPLTTEVKDYMSFREEDDITYNFVRRYSEQIAPITEEEFIKYIEELPVRRGVGTKMMGLSNFSEMDTITTTDGLTGTLTCRNVQNYTKKFLHNGKIYKPSPRMCWRLMGFTDEDFDKVENIGKDSDLWNRAGNSIVTNVTEHIFRELYKDRITK